MTLTNKGMKSKKLNRISQVLVRIACFSPLVASGANTLVLQPGVLPTATYESEATTIRSDNANLNYGGASYGIVGRISASGQLRNVLGFSLGDLPAGSIITSITLTIKGERNDSGSSISEDVGFNLHELNSTFVEGVGNVNGANDTVGGVTWNSSQSGTSWTPGGDFNSLVLSSITANPEAADEVTYTFGTSDAFVAAAQAALDGDGSLDLLLKLNDTDESEGGRRAFFYHSDDAAILEDRPILTIEFIPEPASFALLVLGGMIGVVRRRR